MMKAAYGVVLAFTLVTMTLRAAADPLPSWNDTAAKAELIKFVHAVSRETSPQFVPPAERIAVFDNDGCLWAEQPVYFQLLFALDRVRAMAPDHPQWSAEPAFKAAIAGDVPALMATGKEGLMKVIAASHAGLTTEEFADAVAAWLKTAQHPTLGRRLIDCVYQPQLDLLDYLRANGFKTFIVSGGGVDFLRVFAEEAYGIPPEQVVGTRLEATYAMQDGVPVIVKRPTLDLLNDKAGKPVAIHQHLGRRPLLAFGNSDGDREMLQYTTIPRNADDTTPRLGLILHHDDDEREFAYDRDSHIGRLDAALDEATEQGWVLVSMKRDWAEVFAR